jgi:hypothetical protein
MAASVQFSPDSLSASAAVVEVPVLVGELKTRPDAARTVAGACYDRNIRGVGS